MNYDNLFDDKKQDELFKETQKKLKTKTDFSKIDSKIDDEHMYFPSLGKDGEDNVVTGRLLPSSPEFDKSTVLGRVWLAKRKVHKFSEGTENFREICLRTLESYFTDTSEIPEGFKYNEYFDKKTGENKIFFKCPCCETNKYPFKNKKRKDLVTQEEIDLYNEWHRKKAEKNYKGWVNFYIEDDMLYPENNGRVVKLFLNGVLLPIVENFINDKYVGDKMVRAGRNAFKLSGTCYRFKIIMSKGEYTNYDESEFEECEALPRAKAEELLKKTHDIASLINIKTYDEVKEKIDKFYNDSDPEAFKEVDNEKEFNKKLEEQLKKQDEKNKKELDQFQEEIKKENEVKLETNDDDDFDSYFEE